jgi:hypothetical protein
MSERVIARFVKVGSTAEIREREVTMFKALEWLVYVNGSITESRMYHGERVKDYGLELLARKGCFFEDGWIETPNDDHGLPL